MGWMLSKLALLFAVYGVFPFQQPDYKYNPIWSSLYSSLYHAIWALGVGWIILACESNHGGNKSCLMVYLPDMDWFLCCVFCVLYSVTLYYSVLLFILCIILFTVLVLHSVCDVRAANLTRV
jgi:hypothetical protein